jgi:hypothetical protein
MALIASCSGTPCCVNPAGLTSAPCAVSMCCVQEINQRPFVIRLDGFERHAQFPGQLLPACALICASVVVP